MVWRACQDLKIGKGRGLKYTTVSGLSTVLHSDERKWQNL